MNTNDSTTSGKIQSIKSVFHLPLESKQNAIISFVFVQFYFICNLLSFGYWKESVEVFLFVFLYFGVWIAGLTLLLALFLKFKNRLNHKRYGFTILVVLSLPMFGIWVQSLDIRDSRLEWLMLLLFPFAIALIHRLGQFHITKSSIVIAGLCILSFLGHAQLSDAVEQSSTDFHPNFELGKIVLDRTPNIHVIKFDGLTHSDYSREFMGVRNPASDYLSELDDAIFAGSRGFQENVWTKNAWRTLFGLGMIETNPHGTHPFSGTGPSPLALLLRKNGYEIHTGFSNQYFGTFKGPYVDFYYIADGFTLLCGNKLLGLCSRFSTAIFDRYFAKQVDPIINPILGGRKEWSDTHAINWALTIVKLIRRMEIESETPVFSAFHIYLPGHTERGYDYGNEKKVNKFVQRYVSRTKDIKELLTNINQLRLQFPDSIFIVAGDHGPKLSTGTTREENERFWFLDRHAVVSALLNIHNLCPSSKEWLDQQKYFTPSRMLAASLACDGESKRLLENFKDNPEFIKYGIFSPIPE